MKPTLRLSRRREAATARIDENSLLVLNLSSSDCVPVRLDGVAAEIWELLHEELEFTALCERIVGKYEADSERIVSDISHFLDQLLNAGLLRADE